MPAWSSSSIDPVVGQLAAVVEQAGKDPPGLVELLAGVTDPRHRRGMRHRLAVILNLAVCAVLAGARSFVGIAEWAGDADRQTLAALGVTGAVPCESTIRRVLQRLDATVFDDLTGAWAQRRTSPRTGQRRVIAVDGKTLRGSDSHGEPARHLLAAVDHAHGVVLGQVEVGAKTNEIPMFATLLDRIDITGAVVTADALHAQQDHARYLAGRGAHYALTVKANQPGLRARLAALPWREVPTASDTRERHHGRIERRVVKVTATSVGLGFPYAAQAIQIVRRRRPLASTTWSTETCYAVTSLTATDATGDQLAAIVRGHWAIEDRLHWVRDLDFDEDRCQIRTASGPRVMAAMRNLAITILRLAGFTNIAAALRYHARRPNRPLQTIMNC